MSVEGLWWGKESRIRVLIVPPTRPDNLSIEHFYEYARWRLPCLLTVPHDNILDDA
jgi:hypothetical protein